MSLLYVKINNLNPLICKCRMREPIANERVELWSLKLFARPHTRLLSCFVLFCFFILFYSNKIFKVKV